MATSAPKDASLRVRIEGTTLEGKEVRKTVLLPLGNEGDGAQRMAAAGLRVSGSTIIGTQLKSPAEKAGFEQGFRITGIETPIDRPAKEWMYVPALALLGVIVLLQRARRDDSSTSPRAGAAPEIP